MNGLSVIIPSRNAANLIPCVGAVLDMEPDARIVVVDDSREVSGVVAAVAAACLLRSDNWSHIWAQGENPFVFARNINIGVRAAGTDDVILLNDDALLKTPWGFTAMQRIAEAKPHVGIVASTCNNVGNLAQRPRGRFESFGADMLRAELRTLCFVCVLIPRRTIDAVGLLDERFIGYGLDDDDYCLRVRNAGLKLGIFDGCYVDHGSLPSSFRGPGGAGGDFTENMRLFIAKWGVDNWGKCREESQFRNLFPEAA